MEAIAYTTKSGLKQFKPLVTEDEAYDGLLGFCLACGLEVNNVEPDARQYPCEACGARKVYGLEELALLGLLTLVSEDD